MKNSISISKPLTFTNSNIPSTIKKNNTKNFTHHFQKISITATNFYKNKNNFITSNSSRKTPNSIKNFALSREKRNYSLSKKNLIKKCNILRIDYNKIKVNKKFGQKRIFSPIYHKNTYNTNNSYIKIININVDMKKIKYIQQWWKFIFKIIKIQKQIKAFLLHKKLKLLLNLQKFTKTFNNLYNIAKLKVLEDKENKPIENDTITSKEKTRNYKRIFSPKQYTRLSRNNKMGLNLQNNISSEYMNNSMMNMKNNINYSFNSNFINNKNCSVNKNTSTYKNLKNLKKDINKVNKININNIKSNRINNIIHSNNKPFYDKENFNILNIINKMTNSNSPNYFYLINKKNNNINNNIINNNINFKNTPPNTINTNNNSSKFNNSIVINNSNDTISVKSNTKFKQKLIFENVKFLIKSKRYFNHWYNITIKKQILNKFRSIFCLNTIIKKNIIHNTIKNLKNLPKKKKNFGNNSMIDLQATDTSVSNTNTFDFYSVKSIKINKIMSNKIYILSFIINMIMKINKNHLLKKCFKTWKTNIKNITIDSKIIKFSKTPSTNNNNQNNHNNNQNNNQNNKQSNNKIIYQKKLLKNSLNKKNFCNEITNKKSLYKIEEKEINFSPGVSRKSLTHINEDYNQKSEKLGINCMKRKRDELNKIF